MHPNKTTTVLMPSCPLCKERHEPIKETTPGEKSDHLGFNYSIIHPRYGFELKITDGDREILSGAGGHCNLKGVRALIAEMTAGIITTPTTVLCPRCKDGKLVRIVGADRKPGRQYCDGCGALYE